MKHIKRFFLDWVRWSREAYPDATSATWGHSGTSANHNARPDVPEEIPYFKTETQVIMNLKNSGRPAVLVYFIPGDIQWLNFRPHVLDIMATYSEYFKIG